MLGMNRTTRTGGKTAFEFLRIAETAEGLAYIAQPGGAPPTPSNSRRWRESRSSLRTSTMTFRTA